MGTDNDNNNNNTVTGGKRSRRAELPIAANNNVGGIDTYTDDDDATDYIMKNLCTKCNVDMGDCNPRQLCGKTRCLIYGYYDNADDEEEENDENPPKKKKKSSSFLSIEDFTEKVNKAKPIKWTDLDRTKVFRVTRVEETVQEAADGTERIARVGEVVDSNGNVTKVWLPGVAAKELARIKVEEVVTYIRPLGLKTSAKTGRTYQNFEIVKDE